MLYSILRPGLYHVIPHVKTGGLYHVIANFKTGGLNHVIQF